MEHAASTFTVITDKMVGIAGILYILAMVLYTFYLIFKNTNTGLAATAAHRYSSYFIFYEMGRVL